MFGLFNRPKQDDPVRRGILMRNLNDLEPFFVARGASLGFSESDDNAKLERVLWDNINGLSRRFGLTFGADAPCEFRIREIIRAITVQSPIAPPHQLMDFSRSRMAELDFLRR